MRPPDWQSAASLPWPSNQPLHPTAVQLRQTAAGELFVSWSKDDEKEKCDLKGVRADLDRSFHSRAKRASKAPNGSPSPVR